MGTSSSYGGPTGKNPLLPPWADPPPPPDPQPPLLEPSPDGGPPIAVDFAPTEPTEPNPEVAWRAPKGVLSRLVGGSGGSLASLARSYIRASGGAVTAARAARAGHGVATTARLGGFFARVADVGVAEASRQMGIQNLVGRDAQFVLAVFVGMLAPPGAGREEAIARAALIDTLDDVFARFDVDTNGIEVLDNLSPDQVREIVRLSVANYVNERLQGELVNCIERGTITETEANRWTAEIKEFIVGLVDMDLSHVDVLALKWDGPQAMAIVEGVYVTAYSLLEGAREENGR